MVSFIPMKTKTSFVQQSLASTAIPLVRNTFFAVKDEVGEMVFACLVDAA